MAIDDFTKSQVKPEEDQNLSIFANQDIQKIKKASFQFQENKMMKVYQKRHETPAIEELYVIEPKIKSPDETYISKTGTSLEISEINSSV